MARAVDTGNGRGTHRGIDRDRESARDGAPGNGQRRKGLSGIRAAALAQQQLEQMTGRPVESVSGLSRQPDGWTVMLELVELERVPPTTDILASYRVELDGNGELMGYERVSRYYRNQAGDGQ